MIARLLERFHLPGLIKPFAFSDEQSGRRIAVRTSSLYTILTVDEKEYYFRRQNGSFDGTGMMSPDPDGEAFGQIAAERIRLNKQS